MTLLRQLFGYLCYFFIIQSRGLTQYLNDFIFKPSLHYSAYFSLFPNFKIAPNSFFFPYTMNVWSNLANMIKSSEWYLTFRKRMLNLIWPMCNETYGIHHVIGLKLLTIYD